MSIFVQADSQKHSHGRFVAGRDAGPVRRRRAGAADVTRQLGPQELVSKVAQRHLEGSRRPSLRVRQGQEQGARAGRQEHAAVLRHRVFGAAGAGEALAHGDAGAAQALRRSVLSVAVAELRRGVAGVHAGPLEDPAVPGQSDRQGRHGAHRNPSRQRQPRAGELFAAQTDNGWRLTTCRSKACRT